MKNIFILFSLVLLSLGVQAQNTRANNDVASYVYHDNDTLTNASTVTQTLDKVVNYGYNYQINVVSDSLSGATAGTMTVYNKAYGQSEWVPLQTLTINGGLTYTPLTGSVLGGALKCATVGTGTQSTRVAVDIVIVRKTQ